MVSKGWVSALLLLLLSLSGCSDDGGGGGESSTTSSSETSTTSATATTTSRSSTTTSTSSSGTTTASTTNTTTGPSGNATGNQTGNQTAGPAQVSDGSWTIGIYGCTLYRTGDDDGSAPDSMEDVQYVTIPVDPATFGKPYTAVFASDAAAYFTIIFVNDGGDILDGSHTSPDPTGPAPPGAGITYTGTVPEDAVFFFASSCGAGASVHYEA